ncbi:hypothetical protein N7E02_20095 [Aliirhizobium terrae]|uniref:DUF6656 family protein n=1 Tax=Terrirhizobium terrae TaxID=2926709 RepID=UPI002575736E|nr:DUF6656 family protein [Rhizobium sp. CC-CFT758]WJH39171.1 hypothetical protein N7E02_20095 [Rhizobium sp. CC-CFT758]
MPGQIRYFEVNRQPTFAPPPARSNAHSEFLRTGKISRPRPPSIPNERRYLSHDEVAEQTGRKLEAAGETTHARLNKFHRLIALPKLIFHRTLDGSPHLGYCHVTAARTAFSREDMVSWSFYIANFSSDIGEEEEFFARIIPKSSRMYFAVAIEGDAGQGARIDRTFRKNGLLFRTSDPREAMRNVLMLGAPDAAVREIIKKL